MGFLNFDNFIKNGYNSVSENIDTEYFFEIDEVYNGEYNREEVDELLYEYICNYKDDSVDEELTVDGLWDYISDDKYISESLRKSIGEYIDICSKSIENTFEELI